MGLCKLCLELVQLPLQLLLLAPEVDQCSRPLVFSASFRRGWGTQPDKAESGR